MRGERSASERQGNKPRPLGEFDWHSSVILVPQLMMAGLLILASTVPNHLVMSGSGGRWTLLTIAALLLVLCLRSLCRGRHGRAEALGSMLIFLAAIIAVAVFAPSLRWLVVLHLSLVPLAVASVLGRRGVAMTSPAILVLQVALVWTTGDHSALSLAVVTVWLALCDVLPAVSMMKLADELIAARVAVERVAATDPLTGLLNRRGMSLALPEVLSVAAGASELLTVMIADIDRFKSVNDVYGHEVGDRVLVGVAHALRSVARSQDLLIRMGGEEMAWIGQFSCDVDVVEAAEKMRAAVAAYRQDGLPPVTISVGVATAGGTGDAAAAGGLLSALLSRADDALYDAKRSGRNRVVMGRKGDPSRAPEPPVAELLDALPQPPAAQPADHS